MTYKERNLLESPPPLFRHACSNVLRMFSFWCPLTTLHEIKLLVLFGAFHVFSHFAQNNQQVFLNRINWTVAARDTVFLVINGIYIYISIIYIHIYIHAYIKVKVKWSPYRPGMAQSVGRGIALLFHDRGTRRWWVVSSTPRPHFTAGKDTVPIVQEASWASRPVWMGGKSRRHRDSIPDRPAHSQSLYRLSYAAHYIYIKHKRQSSTG